MLERINTDQHLFLSLGNVLDNFKYLFLRQGTEFTFEEGWGGDTDSTVLDWHQHFNTPGVKKLARPPFMNFNLKK